MHTICLSLKEVKYHKKNHRIRKLWQLTKETFTDIEHNDICFDILWYESFQIFVDFLQEIVHKKAVKNWTIDNNRKNIYCFVEIVRIYWC